VTLETLWGSKVDMAIERLRSFEPAEGYWLAFSGGKDSQVIYHLALEAGVKFEAHFSVTTVDPPELLRFIRAHYPQVAWDRPRLTMYELIRRAGRPPDRRIRYCCRELKEDKGEGRIVVTGIRWQESSKRSSRGMVEGCTKGHKSYLHPIIDWTADDVWSYHRERDLPHCSLYDEGRTRVGCVLCPMNRHRSEDIERWPRMAAAYRRACDQAFALRIANPNRETPWATAEEMWEWWLSDGPMTGDDSDQLSLFS
jgi:phosphoadenosine phosphosulfate reductase